MTFPTRRELYDALYIEDRSSGTLEHKQRGSIERRANLRGLVSQALLSLTRAERLDLLAGIKRAVEASPVCGDGLGKVKVRPNFSGVRDSLNEVTLICLAGVPTLGYVGSLSSWTVGNFVNVINAIEKPEVLSPSSGTGWAFGEYPNAAATSAIILSEIKAEIESTPMTTTEATVTKIKLDGMDLSAILAAIDCAVAAASQSSEESELSDLGITVRSGGDNAAKAVLDALSEVTDISSEHSHALGSLMELRKESGTLPDYKSVSADPASVGSHGGVAVLLASTMIEKMLGGAKGGVEPEPTESEEPAEPEITVDPTIAKAINAILADATGSRVTNIQSVLNEVTSLKTKVRTSEATIVDLRRQARMAATMATTEIKSATGSTIPSGKVVWKKAADLFRGPGGRRSPLLNFDVPTFEWEHPHPYVPEVDEDYQFRPAVVATVLWALVTNRPTWLHGHTGTGKSTLIEQVCARLFWPNVRVNFDSELTRLDIIGREVLMEEGGTTISKFIDGILPFAMQMPCVITLDECDFIRPDVAYALQRPLEGKGLLITEDGGREVVPHNMFRIIATANTKGQGDEYGMYQGARNQSQAFLDRFQVFVEIGYMQAPAEKALIKAKVPDLPEDVLEQAIKFATEMRQAFTNGEIFQTISPRGLRSFADEYVHFISAGVKSNECIAIAMESTILGRSSVQDRAKIRELFDRTFK